MYKSVELTQKLIGDFNLSLDEHEYKEYVGKNVQIDKRKKIIFTRANYYCSDYPDFEIILFIGGRKFTGMIFHEGDKATAKMFTDSFESLSSNHMSEDDFAAFVKEMPLSGIPKNLEVRLDYPQPEETGKN